MQCPRDISDTCFLGHDGWTSTDYRLNNVGYYAVLPVAIFELFFVLCFGRRSPEEIRDRMFVYFVGRRMMGDFRAMPAEKRKWTPKSIRVWLAQGGALFFYAFAACTYLVCLPFFVFSIVWQERLLRFFPDAENYNEASQWLPWVGIVLTLGAALVGRYHHSWHVHLHHFFLGPKIARSAAATKARRRSDGFAHWLRKTTWRTRSRLSMEWRDLKEFVVCPFFLVLDETRERTSDHPVVKFSFAGDLPYPGDEDRNTKDNYQGPWIKDDETWKRFPVEFHVEADGRTLASWERYQSRPRRTDEYIVYSIMLPPVPTHPDRRTVIAQANISHVEEGVTINTDREKKGSDIRQALVANGRKPSTVAYCLQALHTSSDSDSTKEGSDTMSLHKTATAQSNHTFGLPSVTRQQTNQTPEPSNIPRDYTPTPGQHGGPLNSHHIYNKVGRTSPLAGHAEVDFAAEADHAIGLVGQAH